MKYQRIIQPPERSFFLFGARGTGKSTWLKEHFPDALWVDLLDEAKFQSYLAQPGLFAETIATAKKDQWVIVDEIQRLPNLLNEVHRAIENKKQLFALSGSSARKLKHAGVNLLAGRATRRFMHPLQPDELQTDFDLEDVLRFGTIALVSQAKNKVEVLEDYVQTYLREEIQREAIVRNLPAFARFLPIAALMHGQVLNVTSLARDAEAHRTTISGYVDILEDTLLAFRLEALQANLRVREKRHPKFYFIDPGIVKALKRNLYPVTQEERGSLFEGWFVNHVRAMNDYWRLFDRMCYWAAPNGKTEVDLILTRGSEHLAIELKSGTRIRPEDFSGLQAMSDLKGLKRKIIVYCGTEIRKKDDIEIIPISDFIHREILKSW